MFTEPVEEVGRSFSLSCVERSEIVPADPVDVGAAAQQIGGGVRLVAVAGAPEAGGDVFGGGVIVVADDSIGQSESGRFPEGGLGAVFDQSSGGVPLAECGRVGERGAVADDGPGASKSAPAATSASTASTSSLLEAQCSGVSGWRPTPGALGSAPAAVSVLMIAATFG